jgi:shikimate kinase
MSSIQPIFLVGFMGAGKSTVGPVLAEHLGVAFIDLDEVIERETGTSIDDLFTLGGEEGFRVAERDALAGVMCDGPAVVACGGGIVTDELSRGLLTGAGDVIYLAVTADESFARVKDRLAGRPLLKGADPAGAAALLGLRERLYEQVADFTIDTVGKTPDEVAARIVTWAEGAR